MEVRYNYALLRGTIKNKYNSESAFAKAIKMPRTRLSNRLNNVSEWNQTEILEACEALNIPLEKATPYFFCLESSETQ